jgi:4a-hydroxytetrahydrobiopterin dehydratase
MARRLDEMDITLAMARAAGWERRGDTIARTFSFTDFRAAMAFVNRVADEAESVDHHPDIDIRYNRVTLTLSTHSAGGLTAMDFDLARRADEAVEAP